MKTFSALLICVLTLAPASLLAKNETRFSQTLSTEQASEAGVAQLNSDQVAILDALVRRDADRNSSPSSTSPQAPFSQRLSADELRNSGLASFAVPQRERLDQLVQQFAHPTPLPVTTLASPVSSAASGVTEKTLYRAPEIHGSISLMYGVGSHGYSERGGAVELSYEDPRGFAIGVGYAEVHTKGDYYGRYCRPGFPRYSDPLW